jgi:uncharacterized protein (TIRG00374 family)
MDSDILQETEKKPHPLKKLFWFCARILLAAGIIVILIHGNSERIFDNLKHFDYRWLIPAFVCYYIHFMVGAWRWYKLTSVLDIDLSLRDAIFLSMKAFFFSLVIPGGAIGGDVAKIGFLSAHVKKGSKIEGAFTIIMDRTVGMISMFSFTIVVTLLSIPLLLQVNAENLYHLAGLDNCPELISTFRYCMIAGILLFCASGLVACFVMFMHAKLQKISFIDRLWKWIDARTHGSVSRMTTAIDLYRNKPLLLLQQVIVSMVFINLNLTLIVYFLIRGLGSTVQTLPLFASVSLGNLAGLIPLTPGGIGFRDYTIMKLLETGGMDLGMAKSVALMFTALIVLGNISGGIFFILDGRKKSK